jgi:hypothetical protein
LAEKIIEQMALSWLPLGSIMNPHSTTAPNFTTSIVLWHFALSTWHCVCNPSFGSTNELCWDSIASDRNEAGLQAPSKNCGQSLWRSGNHAQAEAIFQRPNLIKNNTTTPRLNSPKSGE